MRVFRSPFNADNMRIPVTKISFNGEAVAHMSKEQFIAHFQATYPDADLSSYADELGLISEPVGAEPPAAIPSFIEGGELLGPTIVEDPATSSRTSKRKTKDENK